jgi:hypothetical protein
MKAYAPYYHILVLAVAACSGDGKGTETATDTGATGDNTTDAPVCVDPVEVTCVDEIVSDLSLQDDMVTEGEVTDRVDGDDFVTSIDATAGGFGNETQNPWVYVRFTTSGAERVDIDDETALESMEWHLAARRFVLRLNGGSSGPSCVGAAAFIEDDYADLTEVPEDLNYVYDDFYSANCTLINDASGLEGSPQVALSPWWEYPGCVETTEVPFLVQLEDGHVIKLRVEQYYTEQASCNEDGFPSGESARIEIRWTFLQ